MKNLLLIILTLISTISFASINDVPFEKILDHSFKVKKSTLVKLKNKFGKMDVKTWDKSEVYIKVTIKVDANTQEKANAIFDRISVEFSEGEGMVMAETIIQKKYNSWFGSSNNSEEYSIDWEVFMPSENNLDLSNKYGDTYIVQMHSDLEIDVAYGGVKMQGTTGFLNLGVAYGGGAVESIPTGDIGVMYGSLQVETIGKAEVDIQYSEFDVENWGTGELDVAYGTLRMGYLKGDIDLDLAYSDGVIRGVDPSTREVDVDIAYGDLKIYTKGVAFFGNYQSVYGDVSLPSTFTMTKEKKSDFSCTNRGYSHAQNEGVEINGDVAYGDLVIK